MNDYRTEAPQILRDFLAYHENIKAHSKRTVDEYFLDLRNFFRYLKQSRDPALADTPLDEIGILDLDLDFVSKVTLTDIYGYMTYLSRDRARVHISRNTDYGLSAASRARKKSWKSGWRARSIICGANTDLPSLLSRNTGIRS